MADEITLLMRSGQAPAGPAGPGVATSLPATSIPAAPGAALTDEDLLALYAPADRSTQRMRANFIASVDGSATAAGLSGQLGSPADKRVFDLLRQLADVVVVGAGTVRNEGYGALRLGDDAAAWREAQGWPGHPVFAIVTSSLSLDPASEIFTKAPVRPLILTAGAADAGRRRALEEVADIVVCGETEVEPNRLAAALAERQLSQVHCEGGPTLLGSHIAADVLDELCLSISPSLEGGAGPRISKVATPIDLRALNLDHVLLAGNMMLTKYSRRRLH